MEVRENSKVSILSYHMSRMRSSAFTPCTILLTLVAFLVAVIKYQKWVMVAHTFNPHT